jgi:ABC-type phosphate/phosphonate transport system ATPase subunit
VAIARALAQEPRVILADEPVAALDPKSAQQVMDVLRKVNEKYQVTVITNLHHIDFAKNFCSRILGVACGEICFDGTVPELTGAALDKIYCCAAGTNDHAMIAGQERMLKKKPAQNADELSRVVPAMFPDKMAA